MLKCGQTGRSKYRFGGFSDTIFPKIAQQEFITCSKCQNLCSKEDKFCNNCGEKLEK